MHREGDLIFFNDTDRERFEGLPDWAPIEVIPGLHADVIARRQSVALEIQVIDAGIDAMNPAQYQSAKEDAEKRFHGLDRLLSDFGRVAAAEIIDGGLPAGA